MMKNLEILLNDGTKVFEAIISNTKGIVAVSKDALMPSLEELVKSVIAGKYKIEFENFMLDTSEAKEIFDRIEMFMKEDSFHISFETLTANKLLEYVYGDKVEIPVDVKKVAGFFGIDVLEVPTLAYDGLAKASDGSYMIQYKKGDFSPFIERFTIGHELGHIFLHFPANKDVFVDKGDDYQMAARGASSQSYTDYALEQEADAFAAQLLMPKKEIERFIEESKTHPPFMSSLKSHFAVSNGAIYRALKAYGLYDKVIDDCRWW